MTSEVALINKRLRGAGVFEDGRPLFRIVWADDQIEKRKGTFPKVTDAGIYLGEEEGVKEVRKYSYLRERWILEMLIPRHGNEELTTKTSYEPIYVFQDANQNYLPPNERVCRILIDRLRNRLSAANAKVRDKEEDEKTKEEEIEGFESYLEDAGSTVIGSHLSTGSGVVSPGIEPILPAKKVQEV